MQSIGCHALPSDFRIWDQVLTSRFYFSWSHIALYNPSIYWCGKGRGKDLIVSDYRENFDSHSEDGKSIYQWWCKSTSKGTRIHINSHEDRIYGSEEAWNNSWKKICLILLTLPPSKKVSCVSFFISYLIWPPRRNRGKSVKLARKVLILKDTQLVLERVTSPAWFVYFCLLLFKTEEPNHGLPPPKTKTLSGTILCFKRS